ncbi:hypothetical protein BJ978_003202 [Agromyces terreus]|uniref:DUF3060 domain-containing protein n=1 Tax=Agromyces terreus TaxID=424795 RepID=A0A9X2H3E5_9MICO|nr:DUF3060 domain-containing protein [Agromyces terreus]MCP2372526.1 hypothetical protein [Agromyces terreus]
MRTHAKHAPAALIGLAGVLLLAGCVMPVDRDPAGVDGSDGSDGSNAAGGRQQVSCAETSSITLEGQRVRYDVEGDCAEVIVRGDDLTVRLNATTALSIEGQDNDIESRAELGAVTINGNDNDVEARTIASITISGRDNDLEAATVGSVEISGEDNSIEADNDPQPVRINGNGNTVERR